jgi:AcrR family transcriptional regulator
VSLEDGSEWAPQRAIRERVTAALTAYTRNWHVVRAWIQAEGIHPEVEQTRSRIRESITGTLAELLASDQRKGLIEPDVDTVFASRALVAMVEEYATRTLAAGRKLSRRDADKLTKLWVRALYSGGRAGRPS